MEEELWERYLDSRSDEDRNLLVEAYRGLADRVARRLSVYAGTVTSGAAEADDLVGIATEGLIRAVESFDPSRGFSFEAYARVRMTGHVKDVLRNGDFLSRRDRQTVKAWMAGEEVGEEKAKLASRLVSQYPKHSFDLDESRVADTCVVEDTVLDRVEVTEMLSTLDPLEAFVVEYRYLRGMSLSAIGAMLAVTESRVSQINRAAVDRLRRMSLSEAG